MKPPTKHLYTAEEVAGLLNLHVKTVRRYVQEGRLKARRIGKEYRITRADLTAFAGDVPAPETPVARTRQVVVSSILDAEVVSPQLSHRITTLMMASLNSSKGDADAPRVDSIYYPEQAKLRVMITASPAVACDLLKMVNALLEDRRG
jgi:excisionase family DNA binding protein